jgi:hypothetical protein
MASVGSAKGIRLGPWGFYCEDETAARHDSSSPCDTQDRNLAHARFPPSRPTRDPGGLPADA